MSRGTTFNKKKTQKVLAGEEDEGVKLLGKIKTNKEEEDEADDDEDEQEDGDENEFYDFHEPMKSPDILLQFGNNRRFLDIEFVPGNRLLLESSFEEQSVEVY